MKDLVVKDNALINASYNLDLVEQRLVLLAIIEARQTGKGINANDALVIHASSYIENFGVEKHTAYAVLKEASKVLFDRRFTYQSLTDKGNVKTTHSRWVSEISYIDNEASVSLIFSPAVVPLITRLEQRFTSYELKQVSQLTSRYAIRLYELLVAWRTTGQTPVFEVSEFRQQLGIADDEYTRSDNFKRRVLDIAISQINTFTDIKVNFEQHKTGRSISGYSFSFKQKTSGKNTSKTSSEQLELIGQLTDKQILLFSGKLAYDPTFASKYSKTGESYDDFIIRISGDLTDPKKIKEYSPYLKELGFK
ncbi:replication initiation protein RepM [Acinetobacter baumannii]|uniref:replication initiation protein RepM n=1 Tax=Acinetobacter baumannii TaxID=470 RepID=UPI00201C9D14|nr:replication initiation protein RepM [Acinetobacter baumannii]MCL6185173.1 replication initiation protein RepM [Acinetobacter baumannii]MCL6192075.1 replication initiation protein RepM [Acinetobacter baumannii]